MTFALLSYGLGFLNGMLLLFTLHLRRIRIGLAADNRNVADAVYAQLYAVGNRRTAVDSKKFAEFYVRNYKEPRDIDATGDDAFGI